MRLSAASCELEETTNSNNCIKSGFEILFSIPSSSFGSAEYLAVSGFDSLFLVAAIISA
jgi:hypothetical protein